MTLDQQLDSTETLYNRLKFCLEAERLIETTAIKMNGEGQVTLPNWTQTKFSIYSEIRFEIHELDLPEDEKRHVYGHFDLFLLTDHTITRPQFEAILNNYSGQNLDYFMRDYIWNHNTQCLLFFIRAYASIIQTIQLALDIEFYYSDYLDNAHWLQYQLTSFHETRNFFPFCNQCPQNTETQCVLWTEVLSHIKAAVSGPHTKESAMSIHRYFERLNNTCLITKTLEELKQVGGI